MTGLTLDEAIQLILIEAGRGLTVAEITRIIGERKLYLRHDGKTPPPSQVSVRIHGRPALFWIDKSTYPATIRLAASRDRSKLTVPSVPGGESERASEEAVNPSAEWWWEGNIQARVVEYLSDQGWTVKSKADTAARGTCYPEDTGG